MAMAEMEQWRDIEGYEGLYQVSDLGRVKSLGRVVIVKQDRYKKPRAMHWKPRILKPAISKPRNRHGSYAKVVLRKGGVSHNIELHRLVAKAFIPNPEGKPVVNHIDFDGTNNKASNLEWCTVRENNLHTIKSGRGNSFGGGHRKLNIRQVRIIRLLLWLGFHPKKIAKPFGVARTTIISIRDGTTWNNY